MNVRLEILPQPTDSTCGPTCLHAVYRYWGEERSLDSVIRQVRVGENGGTLAVWLACHALSNGYSATIYSYNVTLFDPTWHELPRQALIERLRAQRASARRRGVKAASNAYVEFLELGGEVRFAELEPEFLEEMLDEGHPILTGLSATWLYQCIRERQDGTEDDVGGEPVGHFVVLADHRSDPEEILVADPLHDNPRYGSPYYWVDVRRLITAILLGIVTYDANLLVIRPRR